MIAAGRVLVLEDDPGVRELLELVLAADGHRVEVCATPDDVLDRATAHSDTLAIVDFWGRSHQTLATDERAELIRLALAIPTILVTGRVWADRETCEGLGLAAVIKKPFDVFELTALVSDLVADQVERLSPEQPRVGGAALAG